MASFWSRVRAWFFTETTPSPQPAPPSAQELREAMVELDEELGLPHRQAAPPAREPPALSPEASGELTGRDSSDDIRLIQFAPDHGSTLPLQRRLNEILQRLREATGAPGAAEIEETRQLIEGLLGEGLQGEALDLLRHLTQLLPSAAPLRLQLAELLFQRRELAESLALLQGLLYQPGCRTKAHYLLAEHHFTQDEPAQALRHYEAVLAYDFAYPRVLGRAQTLRQRLDRPQAVAAPTILGAEELGPGSRFLLQRELGRGGSGVVYLAQDLTLQRQVAVKALHRQLKQRPEARTRLFCEARLAAALHHPAIATIFDLDEGLDLVVMEYCAGGTLADWLQGHAPAWPEALRRLSQIARVLEGVHRRGVIHRDLKPANLLLRQTEAPLPRLVLTDFGIAHAAQKEDQPQLAGSLAYMAPELRRGATVDPRADLYACGVILLEMLLGRPPATPQQTLQAIPLLELDAIWPELAQASAAALSRPLAELARELVHPDPARRLREAAELSARLLQLAELAEKLDARRDVLQELCQLSGSPPHSPEVARWLAQQESLLLGS